MSFPIAQRGHGLHPEVLASSWVNTSQAGQLFQARLLIQVIHVTSLHSLDVLSCEASASGPNNMHHGIDVSGQAVTHGHCWVWPQNLKPTSDEATAKDNPCGLAPRNPLWCGYCPPLAL